MRTKPFGESGPEVPVIGQGTWPVPDRDALRRGIALGMTHIDTAEMYGDGESESIVGDAIAGIARERLFLVTKVLPQHADRAGVKRAFERSLRRLGTDYVDCYLIHWRPEVPIEETMTALEDLVDAGKARLVGVSNFDPWDLREASAGMKRRRIACDQVLYNLRQRTVEDHELPWCREHGAALVAYTPLGKPAIDGAKARDRVLADIGKAYGVSAQAIALAFLIRDPLVFAIPKASTIEHVEENARAADVHLTPEDIAAIERAYPKRRRTGALPTN